MRRLTKLLSMLLALVMLATCLTGALAEPGGLDNPPATEGPDGTNPDNTDPDKVNPDNTDNPASGGGSEQTATITWTAVYGGASHAIDAAGLSCAFADAPINVSAKIGVNGATYDPCAYLIVNGEEMFNEGPVTLATAGTYTLAIDYGSSGFKASAYTISGPESVTVTIGKQELGVTWSAKIDGGTEYKAAEGVISVPFVNKPYTVYYTIDGTERSLSGAMDAGDTTVSVPADVEALYAENYTLADKTATLRIEPAKITVKPADEATNTAYYDGTAHKAKFTAEWDGEAPDGYAFGELTSADAATRVVDSEAELTFDETTLLLSDCAPDCVALSEDSVTKAKVKINPVKVELVQDTDSEDYPETAEYDAKPHQALYKVDSMTPDTVAFTFENLVTTDGPTDASATPYSVDLDTSKITARLPDGSAADAASFDFQVKTKAQVRINWMPLRISLANAAGNTFKFDGTTHYAQFKLETELPAGITPSGDNLVAGDAVMFNDPEGLMTAEDADSSDATTATKEVTLSIADMGLVDAENNDVSANFRLAEDSVDMATLTLIKAGAELKQTNGTEPITYDGNPHYAVFELTGLPEGVDFTVNGGAELKSDNGATVVADSDTTLTYAAKNLVVKVGDKEVTKSLVVNNGEGKITIAPRDLHIAQETGADADTFEYDGQPHPATFTWVAADIEGTGITIDSLKNNVTAEGQTHVTAIEAAKTLTLDLAGVQVMSGTKDITENFNLLGDAGGKTVSGTVTITPLAITITPAEAETIPYDGEAHYGEFTVAGLPTGDYQVGEDGKVKSATAATTVEGTVDEPTAQELALGDVKITLDGADVTADFAFNTTESPVAPASITITPVEVSFEQVTNSTEYPTSVPYDEKEHKALFSATPSTKTFTVEDVTSVTGAIEEPGANDLKPDIANIVVKKGETPLDAATVTGNFKFDTETTGAVTITQNGSVTIAPATDADNYTYIYDGTKHYVTFEITGLPEGCTLKVGDTAVTGMKITAPEFAQDVTTGMKIECPEFKVYNAKGDDVTHNYDLETNRTAATVVVNAREVKLVQDPEAQKSFVYDGVAHPAHFVLDNMPANTEEITFTYDPLISAEGALNVADSTKKLTYDPTSVVIKNGETVLTDNFKVVAPDDTYVTITPMNLTISQDKGEDNAKCEFVYDGDEHFAEFKLDTEFPQVDGVEYTIDGLISNDSAMDASDEPYTLECGEITVKAGGEDVTANFTFNKGEAITGEITISKCGIVLSQDEEAQSEFPYDGAPHYAVFTVTGLPEAHADEYTCDPLESDDYAMDTWDSEVALTVDLEAFTITRTVDDEEVDVTDNFDISCEDAFVTITPLAITLVQDPDETAEFVYDGDAHTAWFKLTGLPADYEDGYYAEGLESTAGAMNVADSEKDLTCDTGSVTIFRSAGEGEDEEDEDVTDDFTITCEPARVKITARPLTLVQDETAVKEFVYDGAQHLAVFKLTGLPEAHESEYAGEGLVSSEPAVNVVDSKKDYTCDTEKVKVTRTPEGGQAEDATANFTFTSDKAKLTIKPRPLSAITFSQTEGPARFTFAFDVPEASAIENGLFSGLLVTIVDAADQTTKVFSADYADVAAANGITDAEFGTEANDNRSILARLDIAEGAKDTCNFCITNDAGFVVSEAVSTVFQVRAKGTITFNNRDKEASIVFPTAPREDSISRFPALDGQEHDVVQSNGLNYRATVDQWTGETLIHSGTAMSVTFNDLYGNPGTCEGVVGRSPVSVNPSVGTNPETYYNQRSNYLGISGVACGYETIIIEVSGADNLRETIKVAGTGDWDAGAAANYSWGFTPREGMDGEYTIRVFYDDVNGASVETTITVDRQIKPVSVMMIPYDLCAKAIIAGVTEPESTVALSLSGTTLGTAQTDRFGRFQLLADVPDIEDNDDFNGYVDRNNFITVTLTDKAGNRETITYDAFEHPNRDYATRIVPLGRWIVDEDDGEKWATVVPVQAGEQSLPLLLGGLYEVGTLNIARDGATVTASYELNEEILDPEIYTEFVESLKLFTVLPTAAEAVEGETRRGSVFTLANGEAAELSGVADGAALYLVADLALVADDIDEMLDAVYETPYDFAHSQQYQAFNN